MAVIEFQGVTKYFTRHAGQILLRDRLRRLFSPQRAEPFCALQDISFSVEHGESLAVIGHNGAGKSTLLNIATHLCPPSEGCVNINGRVAALLELGSGFHPDLTGVENVRINAAMLGLSRKQARERFEEIVDFAGIREFINEPLRTYSTGMAMRLAFAVAVNVDPDILIVDEVLGVGDQAFFGKCVARVLDFRRSGKTLLVVSHALETLEDLCDRALWLDHGRMRAIGPVNSVLRSYRESAAESAAAAVGHLQG